MDDEHFGNCLRRAREEKSLTIGDVSASTKVPRSALELLEAGSLHGLPAQVFVRGFIRSYAKAVGISDSQPLNLYDRAVNRDLEAAHAKSVSPVVDPSLAGGAVDEEDAGRRRGLGLAVFVIILVLIATITLSLLLRRPPQSGEGLSLDGPTPVQVVGADTRAAAPPSSDTPA
ncbi:MAG TPA: helix-turn-helix domain-containing protein [Polyangia bacterium]|nr:helix-turn-helix domain-containing protein [Polyangia bacterium]